eukprot:s2776_g11.t1
MLLRRIWTARRRNAPCHPLFPFSQSGGWLCDGPFCVLAGIDGIYSVTLTFVDPASGTPSTTPPMLSAALRAERRPQYKTPCFEDNCGPDVWSHTLLVCTHCGTADHKEKLLQLENTAANSLDRAVQVIFIENCEPVQEKLLAHKRLIWAVQKHLANSESAWKITAEKAY